MVTLNAQLDLEHPVSIGSYMNEPDVLNNKFQLHQAMEEAAKVIPEVFAEYAEISGRQYGMAEGYCTEDAEGLLCLLGEITSAKTIYPAEYPAICPLPMFAAW